MQAFLFGRTRGVWILRLEVVLGDHLFDKHAALPHSNVSYCHHASSTLDRTCMNNSLQDFTSGREVVLFAICLSSTDIGVIGREYQSPIMFRSKAVSVQPLQMAWELAKGA